jgi:hypothetical protein
MFPWRSSWFVRLHALCIERGCACACRRSDYCGNDADEHANGHLDEFVNFFFGWGR